MAKSKTISTKEKTISKTKSEIIKEAKRIEECCLYSSKGHLTAANGYSYFNLIIGVPLVIFAALTSASALSQFDKTKITSAVLSLIVAGLSGLMTFVNPKEISNSHFLAGNNYDSLLNKVRIFWTIDCWRELDEVLTERLKYFSEQKDKLNQNSPQIPFWAYILAKKGILTGEASYKVDKNN